MCGISQAIKFTKCNLLPFVDKLPSVSGGVLEAAAGFNMKREDIIVHKNRFGIQFNKTLRRMQPLVNENTTSDVFASISTVVATARDAAVVDAALVQIADSDTDIDSMMIRDISVEQIRQTLEQRIQPVFEGEKISVRIFGSTLTGLTYPRSDIDMTVIPLGGIDHFKVARDRIVNDLKAIELNLTSLSEIERVAYVLNGCINEFEHAGINNMKTEKEGDGPSISVKDKDGNDSSVADLTTSLDAFVVSCPNEDAAGVAKTKRQRMTAYNVVSLRGAKLVFQDLRAMHCHLQTLSQDAVSTRCNLRQQLNSVDDNIYEAKKKLLRQLSRVLHKYGYWEVIPVTEARIGVIHFVSVTKQDPSTGWQCDLVVNQKLGIENSRLIRAYLEYDASGTVRRFLRLVKLFAKNHKLNVAPAGTLSSYGWIVLGLHFLLRIKAVPNVQCASTPPVYCDGIDVSFAVPTATAHMAATSTNPVVPSSHIPPSVADEPPSLALYDLLFRFFAYMTEGVDLSSHVLTMRGEGEVLTLH